MSYMLRYSWHSLRLGSVILCLLLCAACGSLPKFGGIAVPASPQASSVVSPAQSDAARALLLKAEKAQSPERDQILLQVADVYEAQADKDRLGRALAEIDPRALEGSLFVHYSLVYGAYALDKRQLGLAERVLLDARLNTMTAGLDKNSVERLHDLRAGLYESEQRSLEAVSERLLQSPLAADDKAQRDITRATWRLISQLRDDEFLWLETQPKEPLLSGWVELARIQRQGSGDIEKQAASLKDWQRNWPSHPANRFMPDDMSLLHRLLDGQPKHIALLLPFSGKLAQAGRAVRDGFLTGYYRALAAGAPSVQVDMVDSNASPDILAVYNSAVAQGAELVIGPLEREKVQVLAQQANLPVPTLALNNPSAVALASTAPSQLYQFSLNPEDEARQLAEAAWANRLHRALILVPDNDKGERMRQSFVLAWEAQGAEVAGQVRYTPDAGNYSMQVAEGLGLDLATGKYKDGTVPPDMVLLVGKSSDAASIMGSLARNGAGALPVYSTSQIFETGTLRTNSRTDGARLCLTPWQVGQGPLREAGVSVPPASELLYALGADAQQLYLRLPLMQANNNLHVPGNTGYLHLDAGRHVARKLVWAVMQDGRPQPLPVDAVGDPH
ncbi:MAG TPA: penicillin-binding protein activator [Pseudomonadales bacterium]|nr:penicillin-binding protein activator [Pseudomonadales bacterium]